MTSYMRGVYKKIEAHNGRTYLIPVDEPNPADGIHVDTHNPKSAGYGGSRCTFNLEDGTTHEVKGPWHTNSEALQEDTGLDITELHLTKVTIYSYAEEEMTFKKYVDDGTGKLNYVPVTEPRPVHKEEQIIYNETEGCLGEFKRGDKIAQAFADLRQEPVYCEIKSAGGGMSHWVQPQEISEYKIVAEGRGKSFGLSPIQQEVVES